jgi:hypothetical protein
MDRKIKPLAVTRTLPRDHATRRTHKLAVSSRSQLLRQQDVVAAQFRPAIVHWVLADRKSGSGIIGHQTLLDLYLL